MITAALRFVISALTLLVVAFLVPGLTVIGFTSALVAALAIAILAAAVDTVMGETTTPRNRGAVSFVTSAAILWVVQFAVADMRVTVLGALIAAAVIGVIDSLIPTVLR